VSILVPGGERVYHVEGDAAEIEHAILSDDTASRANIVLRSAKFLLGREGTYIRVIGTEEQLRRIDEILEGKARLVEGDERDEVLAKLREEDERALSGLSGIFTG